MMKTDDTNENNNSPRVALVRLRQKREGSMINNLIYNTAIEFAIFILIVLWVLIAFTVVIPFICYLGGAEYFDIKNIIINMRYNKIES